jgi:hypothetical protein
VPAVAERRVASLPGDATMNRFTAARPSAPARSNAAIAADFLDLSFAMESGRPIAQHDALRGADHHRGERHAAAHALWPISTR